MLRSFFKKSLLCSVLTLNFGLITACRAEKEPKIVATSVIQVDTMEPALTGYLDAYLQDAAAAGVPVAQEKVSQLRQLTWVDHIDNAGLEEGGLLGHCQRRSKSGELADTTLLRIEVRRPNAQNKVGATLMDDITLKAIMYHELGHCLHDFAGHLHNEGAAIMSAHLEFARYLDFPSMLQEHFSMLKERSLVPAS